MLSTKNTNYPPPPASTFIREPGIGKHFIDTLQGLKYEYRPDVGLALDGANRRNYREQLAPLRDQRIAFIFDECHRSQFGDNHKAIKEFFPKAQLFGFTGTPIFETNAAQQKIEETQASMRTTADLFQKQLYVDKNLKHHGLIQAFSRTNRVLNGTKPYGNILDFRQQQGAVDAAIALFSGEKTGEQARDHHLCGVPSERMNGIPHIPGVAPRAGMHGPVGAGITCPVGAENTCPVGAENTCPVGA